jgi:hypothetical protein
MRPSRSTLAARWTSVSCNAAMHFRSPTTKCELVTGRLMGKTTMIA